MSDYALGGAMALAFWSEPTATYDLDVFVALESKGSLITLAPLYSWARERGYRETQEHIEIAGIPVQFLPAPDQLTQEAIATAATLEYENQPIRVIVRSISSPCFCSRRREPQKD